MGAKESLKGSVQKENLKGSDSKLLGILQPCQPVVGHLWKCAPRAASLLKILNCPVLSEVAPTKKMNKLFNEQKLPMKMLQRNITD